MPWYILIRKPMNRTQTVCIYDDETDTEFEVEAHYFNRPAEPDNGIHGPSIEWDYATWKGPFGEIVVSLEDWVLTEVMESLCD